MRVIQPHKMHSKKTRRHGTRVVLVLLLVLAVAGAVLFIVNDKTHILPGIAGDSKTDKLEINTPDPNGKLRYISGPDFQKLYENMMLAYPNTEPLSTPPEITGNTAADKRIYTIAESRGYILRATPTYPIIKTHETGANVDDLLQPRAYADWKKLKAKAKQAGIPIKLNSGYRSIKWQREYFLEKLRARGLSDAKIASGKSDDAIVDVLHVVAPPGYSRHHTGYTIDLICNDGTGQEFKNTKCFTWLKQNNYENTKDVGWIPSYPEDAEDQGPEPEAWEYVWVGRGQLVE